MIKKGNKISYNLVDKIKKNKNSSSDSSTDSDDYIKINDLYSDDETDDEEHRKKKLFKMPINLNGYNGIAFQEEFCDKQWSKICLLSSLIITLIFIWLVAFDNPQIIMNVSDNYKCSGDICQAKICEKLLNNEITGNLCMDLCFTKVVKIPRCSNDLTYFSNSTYKYFTLTDSETNIICSSNQAYISKLPEIILLDDFKKILYEKIQTRINDSNTIESILDRILLFTDANHDYKLSHTEAQTLWTLLNQKHTFYMLTLLGKSYIPIIKDYCGGIVEVEEIKNYLYQKNDYSLLKSVFLVNNNWLRLDRLYKAKISIGIMDFFLDSISFNPNDEFGPESLYLCSSIESSFGYTYFNEAKLINYDHLINGYDLVDILKDRYCQTNLDCMYTNDCMAKCDLETHKCTFRLSRPQIYNFCVFFKKFFASNSDILVDFDPLLKRCMNLKTFAIENKYLFNREEMPLSYEEHKFYLEKRAYWNASQEYSLLTKEFHDKLWNMIRLAKDPVKPKKAIPKEDSSKKQ